MNILEWLIWKGFDIKEIIIPCPWQRCLYKMEGKNVTVSNNDVDDDRT